MGQGGVVGAIEQVEGIDEGGVVEAAAFGEVAEVFDGSVGTLAGTGEGAGKREGPVGAFGGGEGEVEVVAGIAGEGSGAGVGGGEGDFEGGAIQVEFGTKSELVGVAGVAGDEFSERGGGVGMNQAEGARAGEAVGRQVMDNTLRVFPAAGLAIDEVAGDEGEEDGVAAADFGGLGPIGRLGPVEDGTGTAVPGEEAGAGFGGDPAGEGTGGQFENALVLEADGGHWLVVMTMRAMSRTARKGKRMPRMASRRRRLQEQEWEDEEAMARR